MQIPEPPQWELVVDEISRLTGRVIGDVPSKYHKNYLLLLAELADGSKVTFFPERVRVANQAEILTFQREAKQNSKSVLPRQLCR
jgi:hypothetical protein